MAPHCGSLLAWDASVNDGINPDEFTLHYITVDQIIHMVLQFGRGALMAKFDAEATYHNIAVYPSDCYLLGMQWCNQFYFDLVLPLGLGLAPHIYNSVAEMVDWILVNIYQIPDLLYYLDNFTTAGPPDSPQSALNLRSALKVCECLGLLLHLGKCVGPYHVMTLQSNLDYLDSLGPDEIVQIIEGLDNRKCEY